MFFHSFDMAAEKRPAGDDFSSSQLIVKRPNLGGSTAVARIGSAGNGSLIQSTVRTSGLKAPVMELSGHSGEVFVSRFDPAGHLIASGSMDRSISQSFQNQFMAFSIFENILINMFLD